MISDFAHRISSAIFWAVGRTSVWCSAMRYWANFWSCSRLICKRVSVKKKRKKHYFTPFPTVYRLYFIQLWTWFIPLCYYFKIKYKGGMCSRITSLDFIIIYCNICCVQDFINVVITQNIYLRQVSLCDIYWRQMTMLYLLVTAMLMWYLIKTDINLNFCDIHWRQMSMWYLLKYQCDIYW